MVRLHKVRITVQAADQVEYDEDRNENESMGCGCAVECEVQKCEIFKKPTTSKPEKKKTIQRSFFGLFRLFSLAHI